MDQALLTTKDIIGRMYMALEASANLSWANRVGMYFASTQETENYKWLGMSPAMREWIGGRNAKSLSVNGVSLTNVPYEATLEFNKRDLRRDKTGQIQVRIDDLARRANSHWASLLSTLIIAGESTVCYDGQYFFDTDHSEGSSGTQSNDLSSSTYSELNVTTPTNPTAAELADVILKMIQHIYSLKDDQGEPINETAKQFLLMVPVAFWGAALKATTSQNLNTGSGVVENSLTGKAFGIEVVANPRLTWTTELALFAVDGSTKPFILQEEQGINVAAIAEGSELEFNSGIHRYGIDASRTVGYGFWQNAVLATLS